MMESNVNSKNDLVSKVKFSPTCTMTKMKFILIEELFEDAFKSENEKNYFLNRFKNIMGYDPDKREYDKSFATYMKEYRSRKKKSHLV